LYETVLAPKQELIILGRKGEKRRAKRKSPLKGTTGQKNQPREGSTDREMGESMSREKTRKGGLRETLEEDIGTAAKQGSLLCRKGTTGLVSNNGPWAYGGSFSVKKGGQGGNKAGGKNCMNH